MIISAEILKHLVTMYLRLAFNSINKETFKWQFKKKKKVYFFNKKAMFGCIYDLEE